MRLLAHTLYLWLLLHKVNCLIVKRGHNDIVYDTECDVSTRRTSDLKSCECSYRKDTFYGFNNNVFCSKLYEDGNMNIRYQEGKNTTLNLINVIQKITPVNKFFVKSTS